MQIQKCVDNFIADLVEAILSDEIKDQEKAKQIAEFLLSKHFQQLTVTQNITAAEIKIDNIVNSSAALVIEKIKDELIKSDSFEVYFKGDEDNGGDVCASLVTFSPKKLDKKDDSN